MNTGDVDGTMLGGLLAFLVRAFLLWIVMPAATVVWLFVGRGLRRRGATYRQYLGWVDLNLICALQKTILRPLYRKTLAWQPVQDIPRTTHRVRYLDFG